MEEIDPRWSAVDRYLTETLVGTDPVLRAVLAANEEAGLPAIDVSPPQGKMLHLFARMMRARRILEIGTLGGYSSIWLARALPSDGVLITLEAEPRHASVAQRNIELAGLAQLVQIRLGPALASLADLHAEAVQPFDLIFIDADKPNNAAYLEWALKFSHPGTLIVTDNVVRDGEVANSSSADPSIQGTRAMFAMMASEPRLLATAIQTVGTKGYDGFAFALVIS